MTDSRVEARADESGAALARYGAALRQQRLVYFSVVGVIVLALVVTVAVAWSHGEGAHTTLHTASRAPADLPIAAPAPAPTLAWRTDDRAATGDPRYQGTVVVFGRHSVRGVDARTGRQTWSYIRSDRVVCAALQTGGTTVAVYRLDGNCDELTGLSSATGARKWTRTLDQDGQPADGRASYQVLPYTFLVTTSSVVYAIDPGSGINRWTYTRFGCSIGSTVLGSTGVLISQSCTAPRCATGVKFCGRGPQLLLRDGVASEDDKDTTNPDQIDWNLMGNTDVPVSADGAVSALNATTRGLDLFRGTDGRPLGPVTLTPAPSATGPISATPAGGSELVTVRGVAAVLSGSSGPASWSRAVTGPLTAVPLTDGADLTLTSGRITVPTATGAAVLDGTSGHPASEITLTPRPPAGSAVYPLGAGQLVAGPSGTVAYA